jgi:hypothetical protein
VIGAVPLPTGWDAVNSLGMASNSLTVVGNDGAAKQFPFDTTFLGVDAVRAR